MALDVSLDYKIIEKNMLIKNKRQSKQVEKNKL